MLECHHHRPLWHLCFSTQNFTSWLLFWIICNYAVLADCCCTVCYLFVYFRPKMAKSHTVRHIASMCVAVGYLVISVSHKLKDFAKNFEKKVNWGLIYQWIFCTRGLNCNYTLTNCNKVEFDKVGTWKAHSIQKTKYFENTSISEEVTCKSHQSIKPLQGPC